MFVSTPKCGTHTMYDYLHRHYGPLREHGFHESRLPADLTARGWCVWTLTRNPYARLVSLWWTTTVRPLDADADVRRRVEAYCGGDSGFWAFLRWLPTKFPDDGLWQPQRYWLRRTPITHAVKMEELPGSLRALPWWDGPDELPRLNVSTENPPNAGHGDWRRHYTEREMRLARAWAQDDFDQYGYDVESWRH